MSDILEALRKVELQRNNSKVPGITTRQRYYTTRSKYTWVRPVFIVAAGLIVVSLSTAAGIYLAHITDERPLDANTPITGTAAQAASVIAPPPATVKDTERDVPLVRSSYMIPAAPQQTTLQPSNTTQPQLSGPRRQKEAVSPPVNKLTVSQSAQPVQTPPQPTEDEKSPVEETAPATQKPATPAREQETAVASAGALLPKNIDPAVRAAVMQKRSVYNAIPSQSEVLDQIKPPAGVEVKPFRPNDVIRPPAVRKNQPGDNEPPMLSTLSSQFQSMVPKMTINAQVYSSEQAQRFVVINMKRYNEGQKSVEGVTIESIRKNDIILSYQGQQFRLSR